MDIFKKNDIKAGYLLRVKEIETGDEFNMTVVPGLANGDDGLGVCCPGKHWWPLRKFNAELRYPDIVTHEVQAVYGYSCNHALLSNSTESRKLLWERKTAKKMTLAEIAKELGYPVEIVEG